MPVLHLLLVVGAIVCFAISVWPAAAPNWNRLVSAGLMFFAASTIW